MSRLEELIQELCPGGVEYLPIKSVCEVRSGWGFPKLEQGKRDGEFPFYKVGDMNLLGNEHFMIRSCNYIGAEVSKKLGCNPAPGGTIIFPKIGAAIGTNKKRILTVRACYDNNVMGIIPGDNIISGYLFYILDSVNLMKFTDYSGALPSIRKSTIEKYAIPIPPLEAQREIVRILDNFTELTAELTDKLTAELTARKQQYEYYRDKLLTFDVRVGATHDVVWRALGEITNISRGIRVVKNDLSKTDLYPVYQNCLTPMGYYHDYNRNGGTTFVISAGAAGEIGYSSTDFWAADDCLTFDCSDQLRSRFLYYVLMSRQASIRSHVRKASIPRLSRVVLEKLMVPVPPIKLQDRLISLLDNFDSICSDLSSGLPAEIEARQKQYEYYRDKLLTFKAKEA